MKSKRKVCFVITSFIHYSRNFLILQELEHRPDVDLHVLVSGSALLSKYTSRYAELLSLLKKDSIKKVYEVYFNLEGSRSIVKAKTAGLGVIEFATHFNRIAPDVVVVRGDRFEVLAAATAAALMNIPIAHIEGGDVSGTIDESVRHAVTKFAHIHFATNDHAKRRILRMGEHPRYVFNFGSPDIEVAKKASRQKHDLSFLAHTGSGAVIDPRKDFVMVSYHPVTSEIDRLGEHTDHLLSAVYELGVPALWFWPNFDAGAEEHISQRLRVFNDTHKDHRIKFMRYVPPAEYLGLLRKSRCLVGNSSAGIKECSYLGVPVVNVGSRQHKRLNAPHVLHVSHDAAAIKRGIERQMKTRRYPMSSMYYKPHTSRNIAKTIATVPLYIQKSFNE